VPTLKVPNRQRVSPIALIERRIPTPEDLIVLAKPLLNATIRISHLLRGCSAKWALGGDIAEILLGVNVQPDDITILTTTEGCDEISSRLAIFQVEAPKVTERTLERSAEINARPFPVRIRSRAARFNVDGQILNVHGDLQIKVGDWEWGDTLYYNPEYVYVVNEKVPVVPLQLKTELYMGLGWVDRVRKINEAMAKRHHKFS